MTNNDVIKIFEGLSPDKSNAVITDCYHVSPDGLSDSKFDDVLWFSDKILYPDFGNVVEKCRITMENPLIIDAQCNGWDDPLYWYMFDDDGNQTRKPDDEFLLDMAPKEIWEFVESQGYECELEWADIPYHMTNGYLYKDAGYDGVIIKNMGETPNCRVICTDYVVFSMDNVEVLEKKVYPRRR